MFSFCEGVSEIFIHIKATETRSCSLAFNVDPASRSSAMGSLFKMHVFLFNPDLPNQQLSGRAQIPVSKPGLRCSDAHLSLRTLLQCRPVIRGVMCARKGPRSPRKAKEPPERLWPPIQRLANEHAALCFQEAQMLKVQGEPCRVLPRRPPHLRGLHLSDHSVSTQSCQCR